MAALKVRAKPKPARSPAVQDPPHSHAHRGAPQPPPQQTPRAESSARVRPPNRRGSPEAIEKRRVARVFNDILGDFLALVDAGRWPTRDPRAISASVTGIKD
jgi:hypothetical protein